MAWALHKVEQDIKLLLHKFQRLAGNRHGAAIGIKSHIAEVYHQLAGGTSTAQHALHASDKLGRVEGFGQVVIGTILKAIYLILQRVTRRHDNHILALAHCADMLQQAQAVIVGQHNIE